MIPKTVCLLFLGVSCLATAGSALAAESSGAVFIGDTSSIDRAVLDAATLSAPALNDAPRRAAERPVYRRAVQPVAHDAMISDEPQAGAQPKRAGLLSRIKSAWSFGDKTPEPAADPFATAQRAARNRVAQRAPTRDPQLQPIPAYLPAGSNQVTTAGLQRAIGADGQPIRNSSGIALRQDTGKRNGLLSGLWSNGNKATDTPPMPMASSMNRTPKPQPGVRKQSKPSTYANVGSPQPAPSQRQVTRSQPRQSTYAKNATRPQPAALKPAPRPKTLTSWSSKEQSSVATTKPVLRGKGKVALVSDTAGDQAGKAKSAVATVAAPEPALPKRSAAPQVIASRPSPMPVPAAERLPKPIAKQAKPPAQTVVTLPVEPKRLTPHLISDGPTERVAPNPYARTNSRRGQSKRRQTTPSADATEPSERSRSLLADAHSRAAEAVSHEDFTEVIKHCRYVLAIDKSTQAKAYANQLAGWALTKRGDFHDASGRYDESRIDYQEAIRADAECWRAEHALGVLCAREGDADTALLHFNRTIELNPEHAKAYSNRAALSVQAGKYQAALRDYGEAIAVNPDLAVAHTGRGRVCHMVGRMDEGLQHLDAAAILAPEDAMIATGRGDLLTDLGHYGQALTAYERAIVLDPAAPAAYRNLAWLQATCPVESFRNPQSALRNVERAAQLSGTADDLTLDTKAAALAALGRFEEAKQLQLQAIESAPESDSVVYRERLALYERGETFTSRPVGLRQATYVR